jgi:hypothetical protein
MRITKPSGKRDATGHIEKSHQLRGWVALRQQGNVSRNRGEMHSPSVERVMCLFVSEEVKTSLDGPTDWYDVTKKLAKHGETYRETCRDLAEETNPIRLFRSTV